jgi:predicted nucleic acid-binding protein
MRAFLDTNILIDFLEKDRPSSESSSIIWEAARMHRIEVFVTTQSILDMFYVVSDIHKDRQSACDFIYWMIHHINVEYVSAPDLLKALASPDNDLEDNAQISYAEIKGCDVFITNDRKILKRTDLHPMLVMTPEQFVEKMKS